MTLPSLDSFSDLVDWCESKANEEVDGTSDWETEAQTAVVEAHRRLVGVYPWQSLEVYPPGVVSVPARVTDLTLTVTAGQTSATLGGPAANYAASLQYYKFRPSGADYLIRITAHSAGSISATVDNAPRTLSAAAGTLFQDEVALPSDFHLPVDAAWTHEGQPIPIRGEEDLRWLAELPSEGWPPEMACRVGQDRLRFSSYPNARMRVEIPYTQDPGDPSGTGTLTIESYLRPIVAQMALPAVLRLKKAHDEAREAETLGQRMLAEAIDRETRLRRSQFSRRSHEQPSVPLWA